MSTAAWLAREPPPTCPIGDFCTDPPGHEGACWDPFVDPMSAETVARLAAKAPKVVEFSPPTDSATQLDLFA